MAYARWLLKQWYHPDFWGGCNRSPIFRYLHPYITPPFLGFGSNSVHLGSTSKNLVSIWNTLPNSLSIFQLSTKNKSFAWKLHSSTFTNNNKINSNFCEYMKIFSIWVFPEFLVMISWNLVVVDVVHNL